MVLGNTSWKCEGPSMVSSACLDIMRDKILVSENSTSLIHVHHSSSRLLVDVCRRYWPYVAGGSVVSARPVMCTPRCRIHVLSFIHDGRGGCSCHSPPPLVVEQAKPKHPKMERPDA